MHMRINLTRCYVLTVYINYFHSIIFLPYSCYSAIYNSNISVKNLSLIHIDYFSIFQHEICLLSSCSYINQIYKRFFIHCIPLSYVCYMLRSEERRVGKECRSRRSRCHKKKKEWKYGEGSEG